MLNWMKGAEKRCEPAAQDSPLGPAPGASLADIGEKKKSNLYFQASKSNGGQHAKE
jgi:hypothetical protein